MRRDLAAWLVIWQGKSARLRAWVEENIEEALTCYRLAHHQHMQSTNLPERLNQEIERRTHVVRIFPHAACLPQAGTERRRSAEPRNIPVERGHPIC